MHHRKSLIPLLALLLLVGCAVKSGTKLPPGAINAVDANSFVDLMGAQAALQAVKADYAAGKLPSTPATKTALNSAIAAYNTAEASWQAYHAGKTNDSAVMVANVTAAVAAVASLIKIATGGA